MDDLLLKGPGLVLLLGATGSGKTTLLRSATGMLKSSGMQSHGRVETLSGTHRIGYLPQDALDAFLSFDAEHEFLLRLRAQGLPFKTARDAARAHVAGLDLGERTQLPVVRLSAGERKRLALDAIQCHDPHVLLLDEPFNHLDASWRPRIAQAIRTAATQRLVLVATHEVDPVLLAAHRVLVLRGGRITFDGTPDGLRQRASEFPELTLAPPPQPPRRVPSTTGPPLLQLDQVRVEVDGHAVLRAVTGSLGVGIHALVGPNGSGKTTLLRTVAGLQAPTSGRVRVMGRDPARDGPAETSRRVALHLEDPTVALFAESVDAEIHFTPNNHGIAACDAESRVREARADFDLEALQDRNPWTLSGGERERLMLACTSAARTAVVLLDEPTHGLDASGRAILHAFLERVAASTCVILATHDANLARRAHDVHALVDGQLVPHAAEAMTSTSS